MSVYVETECEADRPTVLQALGTAPGVEVSEDFPTPLEVAGEETDPAIWCLRS